VDPETGNCSGEAHALFSRTTQAAMTIAWSQVRRQGFLDSIANDVLLPHQLWEICRLLRIHTSLRAEQAAASVESALAQSAQSAIAVGHTLAMPDTRHWR
jgi:hypothetical protein